MTGRQRLQSALNHVQTDRPPADLGSVGQTGIHAAAMYRLRESYGLPQKPIKIIEPFQMLGEVDEDLRRAMGVDVVGLWGTGTMFGYKNENWKPWAMPDGTPVLMGGGFECDVLGNGDVCVYPGGNRNAPYSMRMPAGGFFFDNIERSPEPDWDNLTPIEDFKGDYRVAGDEEARHWERESVRLWEETDCGVIGLCGGAGFGDMAWLAGPFLEHPRGIRKMEDWLVAHVTDPDYITEIFDYQLDICLKNLEIYRQAVGERIQAVWLSGTDYGTQNSCFLSADMFRRMYKPYYKKVNDWVHKHTGWKTFYHSCGAIGPLLADFIGMGADIINPVQCSAAGMDARALKDRYGADLVFWGGGVDTQSVLPYGTPEEVRAQVRERIGIFSDGGGYVFAPVHNIVANAPTENVMAMIEAAMA